MRVPVPELAPKLAATLDAFAAEGIQLAPAEIVWLAGLRAKCDGKADGSVPWVMGSPLHDSGELWWPLHMLAEKWFVRTNRLFAGFQNDQIAAYLYAHIHSEPGDKHLLGLSSLPRIRQTVRDWWDVLALHEKQIGVLCDRLRELDGDSETVPDPSRREAKEDEAQAATDCTTSFLSTMCKAFPGVSPDYWLTEISAHDARAMLMESNTDGSFATSHVRREAQANYLKAVKWIRINHERD